MTIGELLAAADWDEFEINGEMFFSADSAIRACGNLQVESWRPVAYTTWEGDWADVKVEIRTA